MIEREDSSKEEKLFADILNYIPLGSLISSCRGELDNDYSQNFKEFDHLPPSCSCVTGRLQHRIQDLCKKRLVRIFIRKQRNHTLHSRIYVLPDDVGRSFVDREHNLLGRTLSALVRLLDNSFEGWNGHNSERTSLYDLGSKNDDSLFYIFNRLPSPTNGALNKISCPYSNNAIQDVLDSAKLPGLKTPLYPYQKRTVATMIRREAEPARALDPRIQPLTGPTGQIFYFDALTGRILRDRKEYDEACGGILGESMGLGKTLICLATILSTKGHWPLVPPEYSLDLHPIRPRVASLIETAASAIAHLRIPWKAYFDEMLLAGEDLAACRALLEKTTPYYEIPAAAASGRAMRHMDAMPQRIWLSSASLVIVPQNLLSQWKSEIERHVEEGELAVLCLDITSGSACMPSAQQLQRYDNILMTRQRLEREMVLATDPKHFLGRNGHIGRNQVCSCINNLEHESPLEDMHFLRVIMDEGHEFSSYGQRNKTYWALKKLKFDRRWIVSGTPSSGLIGVEVEAAASETAATADDASEVAPSMTSNEKLLQRRRKEIALVQERKDLEKLGGLVVDFLDLKPWANKGAIDLAMWSKHVMPSADGIRKPGSLQKLLESLVVRHRIEDVEIDLKLPPLYNRVVYLKPSWYDKVSINLFAFALVSNFVTSERKDEDYMFHHKNKRFLNSLIINLRQANFYWTSWTPEQVQKTIEASRVYLDEHRASGNAFSEEDGQLLQQGIDLGEVILQCKAWKVLSEVHEMGIFVEDFPEKAQHAWSLIEQEGSEALMSGASQVAKAQDCVDAQSREQKSVGCLITSLADLGIKTIHELWAKDDKPVDPKVIGDQTAPPLGAGGIPQISQKHTISRVKASPKQRQPGKLSSAFPITKIVSGDRTSDHSKVPTQPNFDTSDTPSTMLLDSSLTKAKIIGTTSSKLSYLLDQLARLHTSEKMLVFYEGDHIAYYIAQALELLSIRYLIYTSSLASARQTAYVTTFNSTPTFRVLLMDVHHAAHGLHIASASRVFFVNPVWQPNVEAQAIKRAHRIGQTRPVYVETLVLEGTFEDQMLRRRKGMTAEEHRKAAHSLLDDDTMSSIIQHASFTPFHEHEVQNHSARIARLQTPQQLFDRPDRPTSENAHDQDADLIFPDGRPEKGRKRKQASKNAPEMAVSPRTPTKLAA